MCHHRNSFPHLTKGLFDRWVGVEGLGARGWGRTHLGQAGSEEHALEELAHPLEELVHVWPLQHVHLQRQEAASSVRAGTGDGPGPNARAGRVPKMTPPPACGVYEPDGDPGFMRGSYSGVALHARHTLRLGSGSESDTNAPPSFPPQKGERKAEQGPKGLGFSEPRNGRAVPCS